MRFIDASGAPVSGLVVRLSAVSAASDAPSGSRTAASPSDLAVVRSDASGYCSVKLDHATIGNEAQVLVTYGASPKAVHTLSLAQLLAGDTVQTLSVESWVLPIFAPQLGIPAIPAPDCGDAAASPSSIGAIPQITADGGICSQLTPTTLRVRRYPAYTVHADICRPDTASCPDTVQFVHGVMLEYEVAWQPKGTALGELLHTVTLAPCEQINIAVVDWIRREAASQSQSVQVQQQALQSMNRDRLISDTMKSTVNTSAKSYAYGGALGASIPTKKVNITASLGGAMTGSTYSQQAAISTTNQLSESISQSATFVASQNSTVVFNATASEQTTSQTRTVRNNNHCHALTMAYYEINESYCVDTAFKGWRNVILIKYDNAVFTPERIAANADILKGGLLDSTLQNSFDALDPVPSGGGGSGDSGALIDSVTFTFTVSIPQPPANVSGGMLVATLIVAGRAPIVLMTSPQWQPGGTFQESVAVAPPILASQLLRVEIQAFATTHEVPDGHTNIYITGPVSCSNVQIMGTGGGSTATILLSESNVDFPPTGTWARSFYGGSGTPPKLLAHINRNMRYYNQLLWFAEDPNDRVMRWSCCNVKGDSFSVLGLIENDPLTVYGDFVVFSAAGSELTPDPNVPLSSKLVTLPTSGVFAEGILGQCNTCEVLDNDRFWDWKSSPCPDNAPAVSPAPSPQAGATAGSLKADAISNMITFSAVPDAGQTAMKDMLSTLLTQADGGSKAAADLLGKLLDSLKNSVTNPTPDKTATDSKSGTSSAGG